MPFRLFVILGVLIEALFLAPGSAHSCQKWKVGEGPGARASYCEWCWRWSPPDAYAPIWHYKCICPDGSGAQGVQRGNVVVAICPGQAAPAPVPAPRPVPMPQAQELPRTCMDGREMFGFIRGSTIVGRSLRSGRTWTGYFDPGGLVRFSYENGRTETNAWSVVGLAILLRRGGRTVGRRKICRGRDGSLYWVDYDTRKRRSRIIERRPGEFGAADLE